MDLTFFNVLDDEEGGPCFGDVVRINGAARRKSICGSIGSATISKYRPYTGNISHLVLPSSGNVP